MSTQDIEGGSPISVSVILIGNELLSGKIEDENGLYVIRRLRKLGANLVRLAVVQDQRESIIDEVKRCIEASDFVITSGGVGPTHDDITLECIAEALDVTTEENPQLAKMIRGFFQTKTTDAHLRMAAIPRGSTLVEAGSHTWPVIKAQTVFVLPGVPEIFKAKFEAIAHFFRRGTWYLRSVYLNVDEGTIAQKLRELEEAFGVAIGSYPRLRKDEFKVRVTVEARSAGPVDRVVHEFVKSIDPSRVVRVDPPVGTASSQDNDA